MKKIKIENDELSLEDVESEIQNLEKKLLQEKNGVKPKSEEIQPKLEGNSDKSNYDSAFWLSNSDWKDLETVHEGKKRYKCVRNNCDGKLRSKPGLRKHIGLVHGGKPFICETCSEEFRKKSDLYKHSKSNHNINLVKKTFRCPICKITLYGRAEYTEHNETVHEGKKPYQCTLCDQTFTTPNGQRRHIEVVHEGKKQICDICGASYAQEGSLKRHIAEVHEGKKFQRGLCTICGGTFANKGYLKLHIRDVHEGKKTYPFQCDLCGHASSRMLDLKAHKASVHDSKKPFECSTCGTCFSLKCNLNQHIRNVHQKKLFSCTICGEGFKRKVHMKSHVTKVHENAKPVQEDVKPIHEKNKNSNVNIKENVFTSVLPTIASVHEENKPKDVNYEPILSVHERNKPYETEPTVYEEEYQTDEAEDVDMIDVEQVSVHESIKPEPMHEYDQNYQETREPIVKIEQPTNKFLSFPYKFKPYEQENRFEPPVETLHEPSKKIDENVIQSNNVKTTAVFPFDEKKTKRSNMMHSTAFQCEFCDHRSARIQSLQKHIQSVHGEAKLDEARLSNSWFGMKQTN